MKPCVSMLGACALLVSGCAMTSKAEPLEVRTFAPPMSAHPAAAKSQAPTRHLCFGRVSAAAHLRKRMVVRQSPVEIEVYDDRRWAELPSEYARRAIESELFHVRGLGEQLECRSPILDVELLSFEELAAGRRHEGRVQMQYVLHDERDVLFSDTIDVRVPSASEKPEDVARAIGAALDKATAQVADGVLRHLPPEVVADTPAK
ncbi:MAG: hypothetical protein HOW73_43035 [Polyangiaceae bacterium]|nr:hypothetical protein [Polyangiaceae bacterium]